MNPAIHHSNSGKSQRDAPTLARRFNAGEFGRRVFSAEGTADAFWASNLAKSPVFVLLVATRRPIPKPQRGCLFIENTRTKIIILCFSAARVEACDPGRKPLPLSHAAHTGSFGHPLIHDLSFTSCALSVQTSTHLPLPRAFLTKTPANNTFLP